MDSSPLCALHISLHHDAAGSFYKLTKSLLLSSFPFFRHLQIRSCLAILLIGMFISYVLIYGVKIHYAHFRLYQIINCARKSKQDTGSLH